MAAYEEDEEEKDGRVRSSAILAGLTGLAGLGVGLAASRFLGAAARGNAAMAAGRGAGAQTVTNVLNRAAGTAPGVAYRYPPRMAHVFDYGNILRDNGGDPWLNRTFDVTTGDALEMQDLQEHNAALTKYIRPGMTPAELRAAIIRGEKEERSLPGFWDEDRRPRRKTGIGSTAVSNVRLDGNFIWVRFGGRGKWYKYRGGKDAKDTSRQARQLLSAPSIGRAINGTWGATHSLK